MSMDFNADVLNYTRSCATNRDGTAKAAQGTSVPLGRQRAEYTGALRQNARSSRKSRELGG